MAFIVLKLCHIIAWSWWLVLLPLYGVVLLLVLAWMTAQGLLGLLNLLDYAVHKGRRSNKPTMKFRGRA